VVTVDDTEAPNCENITEITSLTHVEVSIQKVKEGINKLNMTKSLGPDSIHPKIVDTVSVPQYDCLWIEVLYQQHGRW